MAALRAANHTLGFTSKIDTTNPDRNDRQINRQINHRMNRQLKRQLRKTSLDLRSLIDRETWLQKSQTICDRLANWQTFQQAQNILAFTSFRLEPDLSSLWQRFPDKNWGFPRCLEKDLLWHHVAIADFDSSMRSGAFGILEPRHDLQPIDLASIDLILMPAVACDRQGYRLGYGGGFYDRWLPHSIGLKVGLIFDEFYVDELPHDPWDIPLDAVITEKRDIKRDISKRS
ncbi:5-formyltetrahydrofolate cyclo-ligase [Pseudanabaena sp. 'Roaring Creek']|uniref:5-formyltetrahydrofolate cyclo-ligase n=1 Tax=Pseudanabaena sp. 'Roaring Creek' TaxID=1681830 RepID=UPI000B04C22B|nr:5-formyltetrahydrofolate cyclo-ligase [Pseudanabaena sp. 'Roaring Creek']